MKKAITIIFLFVSVLSFGQAKKDSVPKIDSVTITFSIADLQLVGMALDNAHADHIEVKKLLTILQEAYIKQTQKK